MSESIEAAPAPLGRRARKKERTRRDLYDAAMRLFLARGFDAVTIDDICHAADVARATFFLHFPTKDALLVEYGERATEELAARLRERRRSAATDLRLALDFLAERARRHAEVVRLTVREIMARPAALAETTERTRDLVQLLGAVVRRGQAAGELRRGVDPVLAGAMLAATYLSIVAEWTRRRQGFDLRAAVDQALDVVLNGLVHRRQRGKR
jgi:AcrR family transcriptional regulator